MHGATIKITEVASFVIQYDGLWVVPFVTDRDSSVNVYWQLFALFSENGLSGFRVITISDFMLLEDPNGKWSYGRGSSRFNGPTNSLPVVKSQVSNFFSHKSPLLNPVESICYSSVIQFNIILLSAPIAHSGFLPSGFPAKPWCTCQPFHAYPTHLILSSFQNILNYID